MPYNYDQKFQEQLGQIRANADARQKFLDMIYARMEAEENARMQEEQQAESSGKLNWFDDTFKGFQAGAATGQWQAALAGAIAGTAKGQLEAFRERKARGDNNWSAFHSTVGDTPFGMNLGSATTGAWGKGKLVDFGAGQRDSYGSLGGGGLEAGLGGAASLYGAKQRKASMESTAKSDAATRAAEREHRLRVARILAERDRPVNTERTGFDLEGAYSEPGAWDR